MYELPHLTLVSVQFIILQSTFASKSYDFLAVLKRVSPNDKPIGGLMTTCLTQFAHLQSSAMKERWKVFAFFTGLQLPASYSDVTSSFRCLVVHVKHIDVAFESARFQFSRRK